MGNGMDRDVHPENRLSAPASMPSTNAEYPLRKGAKMAWTETRNCLWCGKPFVVSNVAYDKYSGVKTPKQHYCDRACSTQGRWQRPYELKLMTPTEAAYLAALIDGEGCINAISRRRLKSNPDTPDRKVWRVSVANTYLDVLAWCVATTGVGTVNQVRKATERHKAAYQWTCYASTARGVLEQCLPYMIIKREKAMIAIADLKELESRSVERQPALKLVADSA